MKLYTFVVGVLENWLENEILHFWTAGMQYSYTLGVKDLFEGGKKCTGTIIRILLVLDRSLTSTHTHERVARHGTQKSYPQSKSAHRNDNDDGSGDGSVCPSQKRSAACA